MPESGKKLKVVILNRSDSTGGAAVVSLRLAEALRSHGVDARMVVAEKLSGLPFVHQAASGIRLRRPFLAERLRVFFANGFNRSTLFRIDPASDGLPLWNDPVVKDADIICLNWVNQGMLSLHGLEKLIALGKPIVWTMHDMWNFTGICHHAGDCRNYLGKCGGCPLLGRRSSPHDMSKSIFLRKQKIYSSFSLSSVPRKNGLVFVAVSNWLAELARRSPLLSPMPVKVIPNAFPVSGFPSPEEIVEWKEESRRVNSDEFVIAMGAARIDDPVKGHRYLVEATRALRSLDPALADRTRLVTFGTLRDPHALDGVGVSHTHLGSLPGTDAVKKVLRGADVIVSSSLREPLPGTLIEGQACGAIPVSFDQGGQGDIITHLDTGYLARLDTAAPPADSAKRLAEGLIWASRQPADISRRLSLNVRQRFSSSAVALSYVSLFRSLLSE